MNHDPFAWGRPRDDVYGAYNHAIAGASTKEASEIPTSHTQQPIITGTSVLGLKFKNGVALAADNMGSYGSLLRFSNLERLIRVGEETIVGISGDISDLQHIERLLHQLETDEEVYDSDGGHKLRAPHVHEYLTRLLYNRRSKMDPLWNAIIVAGFNDDRTPFMRYVDLLGVAYGASALATGFGSHLAIPLLRKLVPYDSDFEKVAEEDAREAIVNSMRVLYYRDARAGDKFSFVVLTFDEGKVDVKFEKGVKVDNQSWKFAENIIGYGSKQL
ncbi:hypothetical protein FT663_01282 [Candidozyma haemuli var. vulneris]|uniref:Proteasome subunit beta n=1 Tax=Candidozyma haemuli TaxID=45357 RepID=A0A2V1AZS3_9ASCO|nr:hypothetical protein CXQ85_004959 [[Candida] haemuloni]KAF3992147.1 hypothetical protein FT662_01317 [[Candida] haemuloni var. vulneris]KAF3994592.1 hypothetical protein FT663_01282 [[Candida] haemuloni var. vulneris]PVH22391.1 hypothetical protein CXQ85_004959 [[Candida] haemuloni]